MKPGEYLPDNDKENDCSIDVRVIDGNVEITFAKQGDEAIITLGADDAGQLSIILAKCAVEAHRQAEQSGIVGYLN